MASELVCGQETQDVSVIGAARNLIQIRDIAWQDATDPNGQDVSGSPRHIGTTSLPDHIMQSHSKGGHGQFSPSQPGFRRGVNSWKPGNRAGAIIARPSLSTGTPTREKTSSERPLAKSKHVLKQAEDIHPILRLGWQPLCEVHCNGLVGHFLGGHDRELYVQCTSGKYHGLPLTDFSRGGCVMTCSQFEKAAGRELSKKWKESIHVVGEGEGSKATLISWLKRKAEQEYGEAVCGCRVWVCLPQEGDFMQATIRSFIRETGKHKVSYSEKHTEELHLPVEKLDFGIEKPHLPVGFVSCPTPRASLGAPRKRQASALTGPCAMEVMSGPPERTVSAPPAGALLRANGFNNGTLWHAGSGMSVNSDFKVSPAAYNLNEDLEPIQPFVRPSPLVDDERTGKDPGSSPLGREPITARFPLRRQQDDVARSDSASDGSGAAADSVSKRMRGGVPSFLSGRTPSNAVRTPPRLGAAEMPLPDPPVHGHDETDVAVIARWLNGVALCLEDSLPSSLRRSPTDSALVSPAARFQAVLVHARRTACLAGYYQAMLSRYEHFRASPQLQRTKMAEFIMAALTMADESCAAHRKADSPLGVDSCPVSEEQAPVALP
eukprot:jgi/Botrbrau1/7223/Bobra.0021s0008.1